MSSEPTAVRKYREDLSREYASRYPRSLEHHRLHEGALLDGTSHAVLYASPSNQGTPDNLQFVNNTVVMPGGTFHRSASFS